MEHCTPEDHVTDARRQALYAWASAYVIAHKNIQPQQQLTVVSGDASFRRYFRLHHANGSFIALMRRPIKKTHGLLLLLLKPCLLMVSKCQKSLPPILI